VSSSRVTSAEGAQVFLSLLSQTHLCSSHLEVMHQGPVMKVMCPDGSTAMPAMFTFLQSLLSRSDAAACIAQGSM
jgi:hypothetical protein